MHQTEFLQTLKYRVAELAVGPSALRKQGAPGVIATARHFLKNLDLSAFVVSDSIVFLAQLDAATQSLKGAFPVGAQNWGAARKALNLFLRDVLYCRDLASHYGLDACRGLLEVPLDSNVAVGLQTYRNLSASLPRWKSIKALSPEVSSKYQTVASAVAHAEGIARVDLDVLFWRAKTLQPGPGT